MAGREKLLLKDLRTLLEGNGMSTLVSDWDNPNGRHEWGTGKTPASKNIYKLSRAVRLYVHSVFPSRYPKHLINPQEETIEIFKEEKAQGFMRNEQDSPIYWPLHLMLPGTIMWLAWHGYKINHELMALASEWVDNWRLSAVLASTQERVYLCGMRGWGEHPPAHDILEAMIHDKPFPKWTSKQDGASVLKALVTPIKHMVKDKYENEVSVWPKMVPVHYITFEHNSQLTFIEESIHSSTPARMVSLRTPWQLAGVGYDQMYWEDGEHPAAAWLPGFLQRWRNKDNGKVVLDEKNKKLTYTANHYAPNGITIDLGTFGKIVKHRVWDKNGLRNVISDQSPPEQKQQPKRENKSFLQKLKEWFID